MLLVFDGKNCQHCPFLDYIPIAKVYRCNLSRLELADGRTLASLHPNIEDWEPNEKPKGCPFGEFPNTLEVQANE